MSIALARLAFGAIKTRFVFNQHALGCSSVAVHEHRGNYYILHCLLGGLGILSLQSLQIPAIASRNVASFVGAADRGKVVMLAFSSQPQASLKLRTAAANHTDKILTGRVVIDSFEVRIA